jgi:hypothetical protein
VPDAQVFGWRRRALAVATACLASFLAACATGARAADADSDKAPLWKLTAGDYRYSGGYSGADINLRWHPDVSDAWIGFYSDRAVGTQWRGGADTTFAVPWPGGWNVQLQPSVQGASGGFAGASLTLQAGTTWFGVAGIGRTDLKPYFNLNFDPNDSITAGVGWQDDAADLVSLTWIGDDRLHTGQRDVHLLGRRPMLGARLVVDILFKRGESDAGFIKAWGESVTWDHDAWFFRLARDPKQNFGAQDATRIVVGARF